jgi:hypothetical protein
MRRVRGARFQVLVKSCFFYPALKTQRPAPFYIFPRHNPVIIAGIKNAHPMKQQKSGNFGCFAFYLQVDAGREV